MDYILITDNLTKTYKGHFKALDNLNMRIPKGSIYGFVGRNGAGKTTLIRLITGLQEPTDGEYCLYGSWNTDTAIEKSRRRMAAVVETPSLYLDMTARQNLESQCMVLGLPSCESLDDLLDLVGLSEAGSRKVRNFSLGMRQRLGIAIALCGDPDFIILDEPINGLDPQGIIEVRELILKLNHEKGITFLISSHILDELSRLATHYGFIESGSIVSQISAPELEAACRKAQRLRVSSTKVLCMVLDRLGLEYRVVDDSTCDVFSAFRATDLVSALDKEGCLVESIAEKDESLEGYFISLVGGKSNE